MSFLRKRKYAGKLEYGPGNMKRLYRSKKNRIIAGVCGGIGEYFDIDPVLIRLLWVLFAFAGMGFGIIVYIAAWIIIPEERR